MRSSVSRSTAAVASSRTRIFVFRNSALTRQSSCLWPTERFIPPSDIRCSSPPPSCLAVCERFANSRALQISLSECWLNGSRFDLSVPENMTGSCGMIVRPDLNLVNPIWAMSTLSILILPEAASIILNKERVMDDLPAPVLPTMPIFFSPQNVTTDVIEN